MEKVSSSEGGDSEWNEATDPQDASLARRLRGRGEAARGPTRDAARKAVEFALGCVEGARVYGGTTQVFVQAVTAVRAWLSGERLVDLYHDIEDAARPLGDISVRMTGSLAWHWSVVTLFDAAWNADQNELVKAVELVGLAAYRARRSSGDAGLTTEAIEYQECLFGTTFSPSVN